MTYSQNVVIDNVVYTATFEVTSRPSSDNPGEIYLTDVIIEHNDGSYTDVYHDLSEELKDEISDALEFPD